MKMYVLSLGAGLLVGVIYSLLDVRSPAPPLVALVGLLGILVGEQIIPVGKQLLCGIGRWLRHGPRKTVPHTSSACCRAGMTRRMRPTRRRRAHEQAVPDLDPASRTIHHARSRQSGRERSCDQGWCVHRGGTGPRRDEARRSGDEGDRPAGDAVSCQG